MSKQTYKATQPISQENKEHLKSVFADFLSHKEYRELDSGWNADDMMIAFCAAHRKFDFTVVLEHFSDLMSAAAFLGNPDNFMTWSDFIVHYAAYCLLDCPLLNLTVSGPNNHRFMQEQLDNLLFSPYACSSCSKKKSLSVHLSGPVQEAFAKGDLPQLIVLADTAPCPEKMIRELAYAALKQVKWSMFAGLHAKYDLTKYMDMEKVFEFWSGALLTNEIKEDADGPFPFSAQWHKPEKYPLHRMMLEYGRERCIPALYRDGFLLPDIIKDFWDRGISFEAPLTPFYGWEKVTFASYAYYFSKLAEKKELIPAPKDHCEEMVFRRNLKAAAFFNEYSARHPRKEPVLQATPIAVEKGELTPEQKVRLANDEAVGVEFSENKRILKKYAGCISELEEWKNEYVVPDFVTSIGAEAFSQVQGIHVKSIVLPEGLTRIGPRAFAHKENIEKIAFPSSLKTIGENACSFTCLKELRIPEGIVKIEGKAFSNCSRLQSVYLPDSLELLNYDAFLGCSSLTDVHLPANLKVISYEVFRNCSKLESIVIPDGIQEIEDGAFRGCPNLLTVEVPKGIKIHKRAFENHNPELKIAYREPKKKA